MATMSNMLGTGDAVTQQWRMQRSKRALRPSWTRLIFRAMEVVSIVADICPISATLANLDRFHSDVASTFCGQISPTLSCCLPCPLEQWIYSDSLPRYVSIAQWFNLPALICQIFLLVTFAVLPQERAKVQGRYLSVGLCVGLVLLEVSEGHSWSGTVH